MKTPFILYLHRHWGNEEQLLRQAAESAEEHAEGTWFIGEVWVTETPQDWHGFPTALMCCKMEVHDESAVQTVGANSVLYIIHWVSMYMDKLHKCAQEITMKTSDVTGDHFWCYTSLSGCPNAVVWRWANILLLHLRLQFHSSLSSPYKQ